MDRNDGYVLLEALVSSHVDERTEEHDCRRLRIDFPADQILLPGCFEEAGYRGEGFYESVLEEIPKEVAFEEVFTVENFADSVFLHVAEEELLHPEAELGAHVFEALGWKKDFFGVAQALAAKALEKRSE